MLSTLWRDRLGVTGEMLFQYFEARYVIGRAAVRIFDALNRIIGQLCETDGALANAVYKKAEAHRVENEFLLSNRYQLAFLKDDALQMAQLASAAMGKPGTEDLLLAAQADTEGWHGRLKNAQELTRRAMDSAQHNDAKESAAAYRQQRRCGKRKRETASKHAPRRILR